MTRTVSTGFDAAIQQAAGQTVWFVELLEPTTGTAGTLTRIASGKRLDVGPTIASTTNYSVANGSIAVSTATNRLRISPSSDPTQPTVVTYIGSTIADFQGLVMQAEFFRNVGSDSVSGFPTLIVPVPGSTGPSYGVIKYVASGGTSYPGGPFNEDSYMIRTPTTAGAFTVIHQAAIFSQHVQHPTVFSYGADSDNIKGWVSPGSAGVLNYSSTKDAALGTVIASTHPFGFKIFWRNGSTDNYTDPVEVGRQVVTTSRKVCFINLPVNYFAKSTGGVSTSNGSPLSASPSGLSGFLVLDADGEGWPYTTVTVGKNSAPATNVSLSPSSGVFGGDCYRWDPPSPNVLARWSNADATLEYSSQTYTPLGRGGLQIESVQESGDLRAQRSTITFQGVDIGGGSPLQVLKTHHRGAQINVYHAKLDADDNVVDVIGPWEFLAQEGIEVDQTHDDAGKPISASVKIKVTSELAKLKENPGIRTNEQSHKRWFPSDTLFRHVSIFAGKRIFWGESAPYNGTLPGAFNQAF